MGLNEDALMQPFRVMSGLPAPGGSLGGWYIYKPDYDYRKDSAGLCPGGTFGQWVSALSRYYAITGDPATREKVLRLNRLYAQSLGAGFFDNNRFPAYCYDKLVCGLIDSHEFAHDPDAFAILQQTTDTVLPYLPPHAVDREQSVASGQGIRHLLHLGRVLHAPRKPLSRLSTWRRRPLQTTRRSLSRRPDLLRPARRRQ